MVSVSCVGKLHAFSLAEQLQKRGLLDTFYTSYAYQKNTLVRKYVGRVDKEQISPQKIRTNLMLAFPVKLVQSQTHIWNEYYDKWVARCLRKSKAKVFIGWSGMSLHALKVAKAKGMKTILERGSTHIVYQDRILQEEYKKFNISFRIHPKVIEKELQEYALADYISIPGSFVKQSFIELGVDEKKLVVNPYGAGNSFQQDVHIPEGAKKKFTIVYLGKLSVQKGLIYLFEALQSLHIPDGDTQVWFIGSVEKVLEPVIEKYKKSNWKFWGQIDHYSLKDILVQCDVGVQPSLQEGMSMVIPQMMSYGIPVVITPNSGGGDIVSMGKNGFIVPARSAESISEKLSILFNDRSLLNEMKRNARNTIQQGLTWDDYGKRYADFINKIIV